MGGDRTDRERRLEQIRAEAEAEGRLPDRGIRATGGPLPPPPEAAGPLPGSSAGRGGRGEATAGYRGKPVLKPPVWTWEVGLYFFLGGLAGMAAVIAMVNRLTGGDAGLTRWALTLAAAGAVVSPLLLVLDLGRPLRFLNMLRVFKWRSAMSVGVWLLVAFNLFAVPAAALSWIGSWWFPASAGGAPFTGALDRLGTLLAIGAGFTGSLVGTYTGVLLAATVVPVWLSHRWLLPLHFGLAGLGSAVAALELLGFPGPELNAVGIAVALIETGVGARVELRRRPVVDDPLHRGPSGWTLRIAGALSGPVTLLFRILGWIPPAAIAFLLGALVSRYGWIMAGRASAEDPAAVFASQAR